MEIAHEVIISLNDWNAPPMNDNVDVDFQFAMAVFLSLVSPNEILEDNIDSHIIDFIQGNFEFKIDKTFSIKNYLN